MECTALCVGVNNAADSPPASLTLPERLDSSSPPMILTLLLLSFYKTETPSKHRTEQQGALRASIKWMKLHESFVFLTHPQLLPVNETGGQAYAVALYSNEIHRQRD